MKKKKKFSLGSFIVGSIGTLVGVAGGYFVYKLIKPDYLKDYEEDDDFDDFDDIDDLDDYDDFEDIDDLDESSVE